MSNVLYMYGMVYMLLLCQDSKEILLIIKIPVPCRVALFLVVPRGYIKIYFSYLTCIVWLTYYIYLFYGMLLLCRFLKKYHKKNLYLDKFHYFYWYHVKRVYHLRIFQKKYPKTCTFIIIPCYHFSSFRLVFFCARCVCMFCIYIYIYLCNASTLTIDFYAVFIYFSCIIFY